MSDLISRDALIKELEDMCNGQLIGNPNVTLVSFGDVIDKVFEQPTAFDVEKVVEKMEEMSLEYAINGQQFSEDGWDNHAKREYGISKAYDKAIEIVRKGGIDG